MDVLGVVSNSGAHPGDLAGVLFWLPNLIFKQVIAWPKRRRESCDALR